MRLITTTVYTLLVIGALIIQSNGEVEPPGNGKISFLKGLVLLKERQSAIFNEETLPALKPIKDILIISDFEMSHITDDVEGVVRVRIRTDKDSGHVKLFRLSLKDGKWIITHWSMEPWVRDQPPKVSVTNEETKQFVEKVQSCFNTP